MLSKREVPTAEAYTKALQSIESKITAKQKQMLLFHYQSHNRTATFTELANHVGYSSYRGANLQYGKLADMLANELGFDVSALYFRSNIIGTEFLTSLASGDFELIMHHELAKALEKLGWE
ncbi:MAG: hypothetical protein OHK0012_02670 [Synechococcales cyanobacterium]